MSPLFFLFRIQMLICLRWIYLLKHEIMKFYAGTKIFTGISQSTKLIQLIYCSITYLNQVWFNVHRTIDMDPHWICWWISVEAIKQLPVSFHLTNRIESPPLHTIHFFAILLSLSSLLSLTAAAKCWNEMKNCKEI